jgi:type II secretory pathway pseudopilin PulG
MKKNKSFSLIEILIILTIIGIISGIGFFIFNQIQPKIQLNGTARELITDLRYAQQLAVSEQTKYGVFFSTTTPETPDEYKLIKYGTETEEIFVKKLPEKINFYQIIGFANQEVVFNPYGAVQEEGKIILINNQNTTTTIDVRPSGFVKKLD